VDFFEVWFRRYPFAAIPPKELTFSNLFWVEDGIVSYGTDFSDLKEFFFDQLPQITDEDAAKDAGVAWLRLSEAFSEDGFFVFDTPEVTGTTDASGVISIEGSVDVMPIRSDSGSITMTMEIDSSGQIDDVTEKRSVKAGARPICQATKLLDPDPIVRRMAEQAILIMGRSARDYLDEQRAKARPELKKAIDRIWQRIITEDR
jgi:hypothetical protein